MRVYSLILLIGIDLPFRLVDMTESELLENLYLDDYPLVDDAASIPSDISSDIENDSESDGESVHENAPLEIDSDSSEEEDNISLRELRNRLLKNNIRQNILKWNKTNDPFQNPISFPVHLAFQIIFAT